MRSFLAGLRTLILPWGAAANSTRIVIGPDIPAELVTWGQLHGVVFTAVEVFYFDGTHYVFKGLGSFSGQITYFEGTYDPTNLVFITNRIVLPGGAGVGSVAQRIGGITLNSFQLVWSFQQTSIDIGSLSLLEIGGDFTIDNVSAPRGLRSRIASTASSAAVGAETTVLTTPAMNFEEGRAYRVAWRGQSQASVANTTSYRIRLTNVAGTLLNVFQYIIPGIQSNTYSDAFYLVRATGTGGLTDNLVLTLQASAGTTTMAASTQNVRFLEIWDVGADTDFPNAIPLP